MSQIIEVYIVKVSQRKTYIKMLVLFILYKLTSVSLNLSSLFLMMCIKLKFN